MDLNLTLICGFLLILAFLVIALGLVLVYVMSKPCPDLSRYESEKYFFDPKKKESHRFRTINDPPSLALSVIVPAYNEEERLPQMLNEAIEYLQEKQKANSMFTYEIIVVDDGSTDQTTNTALLYTEKFGLDLVRVLTLEQNRGKGGAVRLGMFVARGQLLLFADADGATQFSDYQKLESSMQDMIKKNHSLAVVCGSRAHLEQDSVAHRSIFRTILMYGFHFIVWSLCVRGIKDTQCGFKLLTRDAAKILFSNLHVERWAFDVDMLYLAQHFKISVSEVAVHWQEMEGSKMTPFWSWLQMGRDIVLIWLRYRLGIWKIEDKPKIE
ncbi:hypothetical protein ScPMuIL_010470 [Solemya velum]